VEDYIESHMPKYKPKPLFYDNIIADLRDGHDFEKSFMKYKDTVGKISGIVTNILPRFITNKIKGKMQL